MSASRPFAIVTGASTGIGFELAKRCAKEGYDLLIAADEPEIEKAAASLRTDDGKVEALAGGSCDDRGRGQALCGSEGASGRCTIGECRARSRPCVPGPGFWKGAAGRRYQYHRHDLPDPQGRQRYAAPEFRERS